MKDSTLLLCFWRSPAVLNRIQVEIPLLSVFRVAGQDPGWLNPQACHLWYEQSLRGGTLCYFLCVCHDVNNIWKHCFTISDLSHSPQICTTKCWSLVLTLWIAYGSAPSRCWCTFLLRLSSGGAPGLWSTPPSTPGTWRCMLTERAGSVPSSFPFPASRDPLTVGFLLENIITKRTLFESVYSQRSPRSAKEIF